MAKKQHPDLNELTKEIAEIWTFLHHESDRGAALIFANHADDILYEIIRYKLYEKGENLQELVEGMNILSTFNARVKIAYGFDLISKNCFERLEILREIRNKFAHSYKNIKLDSPNIKPKVDRFIELTKNELFKRREQNTLRRSFESCFVALITDLISNEFGTRKAKALSKAKQDAIYKRISPPSQLLSLF
jgi:DNA-binding MltR family transcriptional regulator